MPKKIKAIKMADLGKIPESTRKLNPHLFKERHGLTGHEPEIQKPEGKIRKIRKAPEPGTKPERMMAQMLEARKRAGLIMWWAFTPIKLQIDGATYKPDFIYQGGEIDADYIVAVETKGPYIRRTGLEKFQAARALYGHLFKFEMWQLTSKEGFKRIA